MASVTVQLIVPTAPALPRLMKVRGWLLLPLSPSAYPGVMQVRGGPPSPQLKTRNIHINIFP